MTDEEAATKLKELLEQARSFVAEHSLCFEYHLVLDLDNGLKSLLKQLGE